MNRWRLVGRSVRHSPGAYARLGFVAAAVGALVMLLNIVGTTAERTVDRDFAALSFDRPVAIGLSDAAAGRDADLVARTDAVLTVRQHVRFVSEDSVEPDVSTTGLVAGNPESPQWMDGRYPTQGDEVALSQALADWLEVGTGDTVSSDNPDHPDVGATTMTVVGVFPVLGDREARTAITRTPDADALPVVQVRAASRNEWMEADPAAEVLTSWADFSEFMSRPIELAGTLRSVERVLYFAGAGAIAFGTIAFGRSRRRDVEGLRAAGMGDAATTRLFMWSSIATTTLGLVAGCVLSFVGLSLAKGSAGAIVDESWVTIDVRPVRLTVFVVLATIASAIVWRTNQWNPSYRPSRRGPRVSNAIAIAGVVALVATLQATRNRPDTFGSARGSVLALGVVLVVCLLSAASVPTFVETLIRPRATGLSALVRSTGASRSIAVASAVFVSALCLLASSSLFSDYEHQVAPSAIPAGGLWVELARPSAAREIAAQYRRDTGEQPVVLESFPERDDNVRYRVVPASEAGCLESKRSLLLCSDANPEMPLAVPAIRAEGMPQTTEWIVSPALLDGADQILLVKFEPTDGAVLDTSLAPARPDDGTFTTSELVGAGAAALAPAGTDIGVDPQTADVFLPNYSTLDASAQRATQRSVYDLAPYSISNLSTNPDYALLAQAWAVAILGLVIASTLLLRWNDGVWRAQPTVVAAFESERGSRSARRRIIAGSMLTQATSMGVALAVVTPVSRRVLYAFSSSLPNAIWVYAAATAAVIAVGGYMQNRQLRGGRLGATRPVPGG